MRNAKEKKIFFLILFWFGFYYITLFISPRVQLEEREAIFFSNLICFIVSCPILYLLSQINISKKNLYISLFVSFILDAVFVYFQIWSASSIFLLLTCGLAGIISAKIISTPKVLFIITVLVGMIDVIGVSFLTLTKHILNNPSLLHILCIHFPLIGSNEIRPVIGFADFVFFAIFLSAAKQFNFNFTKTFFVLFSALFSALVVAYSFNLEIIAVLPYLSSFYLIFNRKFFPWEHKQLLDSLKKIAICIVVFLIVAYFTL